MAGGGWLAPSLGRGGDGWRPLGEAGAAAVFHVDLRPDAEREAKAADWLDAGDHARRQRFLHARPRREFSLCRAALRELLCRQLDCGNTDLSLDTREHGKPFARLRGTPVRLGFNVSHSGRHGLIALAEDRRVGVDVEERASRHDLDGEIRTVFAPAERRELAAAGGGRKLELFFLLWTLKEALIKALGSGFSLDTASFEIPPALYRGQRRGMFRFPQIPAVRWGLEDLGNADFAAAVAWEIDSESAAAARARPE